MFSGKKVVDDRGAVSFVNDFDFKDVKRFYMVENHTVGFVRAWHGHEREGKYVLVVSGAAIVCMASMETGAITKQTLSADNPHVLYIPTGYYNGFKSLTPATKLMFFSTSTLEESNGDDLRKPWDAYGTDVWEVTQR